MRALRHGMGVLRSLLLGKYLHSTYTRHPGDEASERQDGSTSSDSPAVVRQTSLDEEVVFASASIAACVNRVENGIKTNQLLNDSLKDFCKIGFDYVDRLQALVNRMNITFPGESEGALNAIESLRSYITKTMDNQREFLEAVSHECVIEDRCSGKFYEIKGEIEQSKLQYSEVEAERCTLAAVVEDLYLQSKEAVNLCSEAHHEPPLVKTNMHKALIPVFLRFMEKNRELKNMGFDVSRSRHDKEISMLKTSLKNLDCDRIIGLRDCLSKFMVYETARVRNAQYDMSTLINAVNDLEPEIEWSTFEAGGHRDVDTTVYDSLAQTTRQYANFLKNAIPEVFRSYAITRLTLSGPKARVLQRIERTLSKYIDAVWNNDADSVSVKDFVGEMQSSLVRQVFCSMITSSSLRNNQLQSIIAMKLLARLIGVLLTFSQRQRDAWSGYAILRVSNFIHIVKDPQNQQTEMYTLTMFIQNHEYWSRIAFWEECLVIVISQDLKAVFEDSGGDHALKPVTKELKYFVNWMKEFGINPVEAHELVKRICSQVELPEDYAQCIIDTGEN
ncbi:hypothetical protein BgAZ_110460 [Babesia gibsoni]|uniref:Uncharacterized protein n=1 Tax=Babesia gibsoni TaxID=33632 RepID=A0AAD8PGL8_BABGI|nr:hypothetical protein BgAZ_110460 [Babesia gibsoni]